MNCYLVRLHFNGPLHIGHDEAGIGVEAVLPYLHSDTLFSAFCNAWSSYGEGRNILKDIDESKVPVLFSSTYYYHGRHTGSGVNYTYFLPRPLLPYPSGFGPLAKTVKNTEFITLNQFSSWAQGRINDFGSAQHNGIGSKENSYKELYTMQVRPRHAQDRQTMSSSIYHCGEVFFRGRPNESGLYFLAATDNKDALFTALEILQQWGFGGVRSAGYGKFNYDLEGPLSETSEFGRILFSEREVSDAHCLLSLFYPAINERTPENLLAYRTVMRKGWFHSASEGVSLKRKSCYMITEGSVIRGKPVGANLDLKPKAFNSHPVYRCGLAFSLPVKIAEAGINEEVVI